MQNPKRIEFFNFINQEMYLAEAVSKWAHNSEKDFPTDLGSEPTQQFKTAK